MSKIFEEAQYVRRIAQEDTALIMAELAQIMGVDFKPEDRSPHAADEALDKLKQLNVAVSVWAKNQRKIQRRLSDLRRKQERIEAESILRLNAKRKARAKTERARNAFKKRGKTRAVDPTCIWSEAKAHTFPPVGGSDT